MGTNKLTGTQGETMVETLVSMLIISLVFIFLVNAIVTSQRINADVKNEDISLDLSNKVAIGTATVSINGDKLDGGGTVYAVNDDEGEPRYYYYDFA